jgi:hypothetical protein
LIINLCFEKNRDEWRFRATILRDRFDKNKNVQDLQKAQQLLAEGQAELYSRLHPNPLQCNFIYNNLKSILFNLDFHIIFSS